MKDIKHDIVIHKCGIIRDQVDHIIDKLKTESPGSLAFLDFSADKIGKLIKEIKVLMEASLMESMAELDRD
jgi:hypothetical protein